MFHSSRRCNSFVWYVLKKKRKIIELEAAVVKAMYYAAIRWFDPTPSNRVALTENQLQ